ncbi:hypothetical protein ACFJIX_23585 [Roseateles sp. UC29_93]|uniref:hypothetical protein n=1 Tax=Roseateles sp. UC29_93 TaxID=3350177 RepID=UPI00366B4E50
MRAAQRIQQLVHHVERPGQLVLLSESAKQNGSTPVEQYKLVANERGFYPVMTRGQKHPTEIVWLERGEAWKFGTTKNPKSRYSQVYLDGIGEFGVEKKQEFLGTQDQALQLENMKIRNYSEQNGKLSPPETKLLDRNSKWTLE